MKSRWLLTLFAVVPIVAAIMALESCAGVGGATTTGGGGGGLPSVTQAFLALLPANQSGATYIGTAACSNATCHTGRGFKSNVDAHFSQTKHAQVGVTCERCHGPGSVHAANPTKDNILTFPKSTDPVVCAQCHGPLYNDYLSSGHVGFISSPVISVQQTPATGRSSRCQMCHSGLFRAEVQSLSLDPATMTDAQITGICTDAINSVPHISLCSTCHNPHSQTGNLTQSGEEKQLRQPVFNTDTTNIAPGTTAAQFTNYSHLCAQCHNGRGVNPADSALQSSTSRPSMHYSNQFNMLMGLGGAEGSGIVDKTSTHSTIPGQCTHCHMPDSRHTFTVSYDVGCAPCHTSADAAARVTSIKSYVLDGLYSLKTRMQAWSTTKFGNPNLWEYTGNIVAPDVAPAQSQVPIEIKRARHNYYFIIRSGDYGVHNAPYTKGLLKVSNDGLTSLGVALASTGNVSTADKKAAIEASKKLSMQADLAEDR